MAYDYSEIRQQQRKNEEDPEKHEHDHEWGNVKGQANVSSSSSSLSVERKRHQRLYFRRHRGVTNEYPGTTDTGCFHDLLHICSNFLHLFYIIFGLALLGYSMAIFLNPHASQWQLWHIFPTILMIWSIFLLLAGSLGIHGLRSLICRRYGLIISAYFGIVLIIWESALVIYFIIEKQSFLEFLRLRETKFYLTEREIGAFDQNSTSFILIFLALALAEVLRYYMLRHLRSEMLTHDNAATDTQRRDEARQRNLEIKRWKTTVRSGDGDLSTQDYDESRTSLLPLLVDDNNNNEDDVEDDEDRIEVKERASLSHKEYNTDGDEDNDKFGGNNKGPNDCLQSTPTSWWEDTENSSIRDDRQMTFDSKESKRSSWISNIWGSLRKPDTMTKEDGDQDKSNDSQDEQGFSSAHGFAPIDDEFSNGSFEWANDCHDTFRPQTSIGIGESRSEDNGPVLSWMQDNDN